MGEQRTPFVRLAKRDGLPLWQVWCVRLSSFLAAILLGALIFLLIGQNPLSAYGTILSGALGKRTVVRQTVKIAVPLLGTALAIAPCFKMRFWNIGAEGQITAGAVAASYFALFWYDRLPSPLLLCVMGAAGILAGGLWAMIPAIFKARWNTNETLFTLMMNYVATQLVAYYVIVWEVPKGSGKIGIINPQTHAGWLPNLLSPGWNGDYGWNVIIVLAVTVAMYLYMNKSKQGFEIAVIGDSVNTARYAGIRVNRAYVRTIVISGAICGLAGFVAVSGASHSISTSTAGGRGFTAIIVAWLAQFNSVVMVIFSFLLVFLQKGAQAIASSYNLSKDVSEIITGIILFFLLGSEFFVNYTVHFRGKKVAK